MDQPDTPDTPATEQAAPAPAAPAASPPAAPAPAAPPAPAAAPAAAADAGAEAAAQAAQAAQEELDIIKAVVLDSAELATRSASLATNAGTAMREATEVMMKTHAKQRKQSMILIIVSGILMLTTACVFMGVALTLFSRLKSVDAMQLAVGKRVTELNTTMETVASVNEALQNLAGQQEQAHKQQQQLEAKLDEVLKSTQGMPAAAAKQLEDKSQAIVKQVQSMDARMQSQAASLQRLSQQVKGLEGQIADSGQKIRSEVENMSRQQRERLQAEQAAARAAQQKPK
ncbi:MAG: hypothetical protein ACKOFG_05700, partial [Limnohabitans sp.]